MEDNNTTPAAIEKGTLNLLTGGPSAGKTTLIYQAISAHENNEQFFIPCLRFPAGPILVVNTDRSKLQNDRFFAAMRISQANSICLVDDPELHQLTAPTRNEVEALTKLQAAINARIHALPVKPSTIILDLYGDFITGRASDLKALAYCGRMNVQWARKLNVAILGLAYPYKQKAGNRAVRIQDRIAGALTLQASANWKFIITDKAETTTHWILDCVPGPMGGPTQSYSMLRADDADGVGRFYLTDDPTELMTVEEIMKRWDCCKSKAYEIRKRLEAGEDPDFIV